MPQLQGPGSDADQPIEVDSDWFQRYEFQRWVGPLVLIEELKHLWIVEISGLCVRIEGE